VTSIHDVAKLAGVSTATVSHVMNNTRFVSEATTSRVLEAAARLRYRPSLVAGAMRSKRSRAVGAVLTLPGVEPFGTLIMQGLEVALGDSGLNVLFANSRDDQARELETIAVLESRLIDGLVLMPLGHDPGPYLELMSRPYPTVLVDTRLEGCNSVLSDLYEPTFDAVSALIGRGHRKIAIIRSMLEATINQSKLAAYTAAMAAHDLDAEGHVLVGAPTPAAGAQLMSELLDHGDASAVVIANHMMLLGALPVVRERGLRVPEELAILSYEDYPWVEAMTPRVSVITQDPIGIGTEAARLILELMEEPSATPVVSMMPTRLVDRGSF
jgi:LacI family transcriptional regulator